MEMMETRKNKISLDNRGFSLVEIIIIIAIMAIFAGALTLVLIKYIEKSRKQADVNTAQELGKAVERVIYSDEEWTNGTTTKTMNEWFLYINGSTWSKTVTDDNGDTYTIYCVAQWRTGYNNEVIFNGGSSEHNGFCAAINSELGNSKLKIKYKQGPNGTTLDKFFICRRSDTDAVEIWVGSASAEGQGGSAFYKVYPDVCNEYKD